VRSCLFAWKWTNGLNRLHGRGRHAGAFADACARKNGVMLRAGEASSASRRRSRKISRSGLVSAARQKSPASSSKLTNVISLSPSVVCFHALVLQRESHRRFARQKKTDSGDVSTATCSARLQFWRKSFARKTPLLMTCYVNGSRIKLCISSIFRPVPANNARCLAPHSIRAAVLCLNMTAFFRAQA